MHRDVEILPAIRWDGSPAITAVCHEDGCGWTETHETPAKAERAMFDHEQDTLVARIQELAA